MKLVDFLCRKCTKVFEQLTSDSDPERGMCPTCGGRDTVAQVPLIRVGGRGDLRESTLHGCHEHHPGQHGHDHDDHD